MKKLLTVLTLTCMLIASAAPAALAADVSLFTDFNDGIPAGWLTYNDTKGSVTNLDNSGNKALAMVLDTTAGASNAASRAFTPEIAPGSNTKLYASFRFKKNDFTAGTVADRYLKITWATSVDPATLPTAATNILKIGDNLTVGSNSFSLTNNTEYAVSLMLDLTAKTVDVWVGDVKVATAYTFTTSSSFSPAVLRFIYTNSYLNKTAKSETDVYDFFAGTSALANVVSVPANGGEFIDVTNLSKINVNFGTVLAVQPTVAVEASDIGTASYSPVNSTVQFYRSHMEIVPDAPLAMLKEYKITLSGMQNLAGTALNNETITFSTAPSGYSAPTVTITSPAENAVFSPGQEVLLSANAASGNGIKEVRFYEGTKLLDTVSAAPYSISWHAPDSDGGCTLKATAVDTLGGSTTTSINVSVLYVQPVVTVKSPAAGSVFRPGAPVTLNIEASSDYGITEVQFAHNGLMIFSTQSAPYTAEWTAPDLPADYTVQALIIDGLQRTTIKDIIVSVQENIAPTVQFDNISDGKVNCKDISVSAADDIKVSEVELYIDDALAGTLTSAPYTFSLSGYTLGSHTLTAKAYDEEGGMAQASQSAKLYKASTEAVLAEYNFTDYAGTYTGTTQSANGGYVTGQVVDAARGMSGVFGGEGTTGGGPYIGTIYKTSTDTLSFKCDVYFSRNDVNGVINTRGKTTATSNNDAHMQNTLFTNTGKVQLKNGSSIIEWAYEAQTWYTLEYVPNFSTKTYDFYWNGEKKASNFAFNISNYDRLEDNIRLAVDFPTGKSGFVAIDNLSLTKYAQYPSIVSIADAGNHTDVLDYTSPVIKVNLSSELGSVSASDLVNLDASNFELSNEIGSVNILSVKKDTDAKTLLITPENGLESSNRYKLIIKGTAKLADRTTAMGEDTIEYFNTSAKPFDVVSGTFANSASFTAAVINSTAADTSATVLLIIYENGRVKQVVSKTQAVPKGSTVNITANGSLVQNNPSAKAFVLDSWSARIPVSNKIYKYN